MGSGSYEEMQACAPSEDEHEQMQRDDSEAEQWEFEQWWKTLDKDVKYIKEQINGSSNGFIRAETKETLSDKQTKVEEGAGWKW
tara:strand:+ start:736 stop:987 length:252 start_codon:yes stop_codon:yes gene_type:complete